MGSDFLIAHQAKRDINYVKTMKTLLESVEKSDYLTTTELDIDIKYPEGHEYICFVKDDEYELSEDIIEHLEELCEQYDTKKLSGSFTSNEGVEAYKTIDKRRNEGLGIHPWLYPPGFLFYTTPSGDYPLPINGKEQSFYYEILIESITKRIVKYDDSGKRLGWDTETRERFDRAFFDLCVDMSERDPGLLFIPYNTDNLFYTAQEILLMSKLPYHKDWMSIKLPDKKWIYEATQRE